MRNAGLEEAQTGIKIAGRNINNLRYADDTTLMAESEDELKSLLTLSWGVSLEEGMAVHSSVLAWRIPWTEESGGLTLSFKPTFSLSTFTFIKRLLSSSSLSAIRVVSSAYLRQLIFLPAILIPACASSSPAFLMIFTQ